MRGTLNRVLLAAGAVVLSAGAGAETGTQATKRALPTLAADLYVAVTQNQSSDVVAPLLERAVRQARRPCAPLRDYQILPARGDVRTLKVKCAEQPTYALTLSPKDGVRVTGGDGTVHPIDPVDGPVTAVWGMRVERYLADEAQKGGPAPETQTGKQAKAMATAAFPEEDDWNHSLWAGALLTLLLALPLAVWFGLRPSPALGFTSEDKDQLVDESQEVLPEIYYHPEGWFIVRGQRGKRRVFRTLLFAYLYRNYGLKVREVR